MTGKPRNPGYIAGDNWAICDVCGMAFRQADLKKRWDGAVVCHQDWEVRHPQDFLRARKERISPSGHVRSDPQEAFLLRIPVFESFGISTNLVTIAEKEKEFTLPTGLQEDVKVAMFYTDSFDDGLTLEEETDLYFEYFETPDESLKFNELIEFIFVFDATLLEQTAFKEEITIEEPDGNSSQIGSSSFSTFVLGR